MENQKQIPKDYLLVDLEEKLEVNYWCKEFGCTKRQLKLAVKVIGNKSRDVERFLGPPTGGEVNSVKFLVLSLK